ncbi:unannotated protein [freshwater metagenome]|uniref:Unannotated protein n=1 Tax=freshwater metagenome TaxID=449393 RepID=A0A6J7PFX7_9ZZZZ
MPVSAKAAAIFTTEIDLPSAGPGDVTRSTRSGVASGSDDPDNPARLFVGCLCHIATSEVRKER